MKTFCPLLSLTLWFASPMVGNAYDPTQVDGIVTVKVDRSKSSWSVTVTNHSELGLSYEMMGNVPRGLGLELWNENRDSGIRIHAEDLADYLDVDGFPADIREIKPGKSQTFQLDPESMSATRDIDWAKWERAKRIGYYECRVFFGIYSSRMLSIEPRRIDSRGKQQDLPDPAPEELIGKDNSTGENALFGFRVRRMLESNGLALVDWHRGSDHNGETYIRYTTCAKDDLARLVPFSSDKPAGLPMHKLIAQAHESAKGEIQECTFEGLMINPCRDDQSKHFASIYFENDQDDTVVHLLLNGAVTETKKLSVTETQYNDLEEYGIPKVRDRKKPANRETQENE